MGRSPCCSKEGLNRGAWTAMEDKILTDHIRIYGEGKWRNLPKRAGLKRCGKSCRLRWLNYLRPDIKRGNISRDEEELIIRLHKLLGNRWSLIAGRLPGRTDNEIKNYWNTNIGKKIKGNNSSYTTCRNEKAKISPQTVRHSTIQPSKGSNSINSHVVRTKASRCTKAVLVPHHFPKLNQIDNHDHDDTNGKPAPVFPPPCVDIDQANHDQGVVDLQPSSLALLSDENNSSEFMMDFELDENFLSDFPSNIDFLHLTYNLDNGGEDDNNIDIATTSSEFETGQSSSPKSDHHQNLLFSQDHMLYEVDLESTTSVVDPHVFDWLQD
ncbi:transcription factor MYB1 [Ziziphus jujuba]|uniref:Transcription factor MYB1 n=2 Tax=Ziziphus jujuba TaxID=326968 RepID=A0A6P3YPZ8_ZIZJJ|nr:transcription factor MYB1 [Ziziphus jujuba]KAH7547109.1 hypothetical protein FEM48_Zijuj01G0272200 [Ziziphus jujuba var. spinosa]